MYRYIIHRLVMALFTIVLISVLSFVIIQLPPGDYVNSYIAEQEASGALLSAEEAESLRDQYGLNQPVWVQYAKWISRVVRGDMGMSMEWNRPVTSLIGERMTLTIVLTLATVLLTWALALPIGVYSAVKQYSAFDYIFTFIGFIGLAVPNFLLALITMYFSYVWFDASIGGLFSPEHVSAPWSIARTWDLMKHLPVPALILATSGTAEVVRVMRANLLDELGKPYVTAARAKGLSDWQVIRRHPVRVALNPFVSTIGYILPYIVSGSIIVSLVLGLPTVGPLLLRALIAQDMFLAGAIVLLLGVLTVIGTFISDVLLMWLDPRVR